MSDSWVIILLSVFLAGISFAFIYFIRKNSPLNGLNYFLADEQKGLFHLIGYERVVPDDGDSFDVYKHYLFNYYTQKFDLLGKQRGTGIDLRSDFIKRNIDAHQRRKGQTLQFGKSAKKDGFRWLVESEKPGEEIQIQLLNGLTTDTELVPEIISDGLVFRRFFDHGFGVFTLQIRKSGKSLCEIKMRGNPEYDFNGFYNPEASTLLFTYQKERGLKNGLGLCSLNLTTGQLIFDRFVQ